MEAKILISSVSIGWGDFGLNLVSGCYIGTRIDENKTLDLFGIAKAASVGSGGKTFVAGHVSTVWFKVPAQFHHLFQPANITNYTTEVELGGTFISSGKADLKITVYNHAGIEKAKFEKIDVPVSGAQISSTKIRGKVKLMPKNK